MNPTMNHPTRYAICLPDGRCLGRYTITGDIVPVPPVLAPRGAPPPSASVAPREGAGGWLKNSPARRVSVAQKGEREWIRRRRAD